MATRRSFDIDENISEFFRELSKLEDEMINELQLPVASMPESLPITVLEEGKSAAELWDVFLDKEVFKQHAQKIADFIIEHRPSAAEEAAKIARIITAGADEEMLEHAIYFDASQLSDYAIQHGLSAGLFLLMIQNAVQPQMRIWSQHFRQIADLESLNQKWRQPYCPFCGQRASISRLRKEDGVRVMFCAHCFMEWEYQHLLCSYCGNADPEKIEIISIGNDRFDLIYGCKECKGYLKTLNEKYGYLPENLWLESMCTFFLDLLAEEHGYSNSLESKLVS